MISWTSSKRGRHLIRGEEQWFGKRLKNYCEHNFVTCFSTSGALCRDLEISGEADSLAVVVGWELDCVPAND